MYHKYKYVTLFTKLYTLSPCLTMFITRVALIFINYFNGNYYISTYTDLIVSQHCAHRYKNTVAFSGAIISTMWV